MPVSPVDAALTQLSDGLSVQSDPSRKDPVLTYLLDLDELSFQHDLLKLDETFGTYTVNDHVPSKECYSLEELIDHMESHRDGNTVRAA